MEGEVVKGKESEGKKGPLVTNYLDCENADPYVVLERVLLKEGKR